MFSSLFLSKNQKLVKRWTKEHERIVVLTHKVLAEYSKNNHKQAKIELQVLSNLVIDHVTNENIEFYKLLKDESLISTKSKKSTKEFIETFKDVRLDLTKFLTKYTQESTPLDEEFFDMLNQISEILVERIDYEEKNLYRLLAHEEDNKEWEKHKRKF
jgi:hypothetical protein